MKVICDLRSEFPILSNWNCCCFWLGFGKRSIQQRLLKYTERYSERRQLANFNLETPKIADTKSP